MPVNRRQKRLYVYLVNIFAPTDGQTGVIANDRFYPTEPTIKNAPCVYFNTDEYATVGMIGRTNRNNLDVIDKFHFSADIYLENGYMVQMLPPAANSGTRPHTVAQIPTVGYYWILEGNAKTHPSIKRRRANEIKVFAYRTVPPVGFS